MAGFEGGLTVLNCALQGMRPEQLVFASDYPQNFTGVNTETGKGMLDLKKYVEAVRELPLDQESKKRILGGTAAEPPEALTRQHRSFFKKCSWR